MPVPHYTLILQLLAFLSTQPKRLQYLKGVLAEDGGRSIDARRRGGVFDGEADGVDAPCYGVFNLHFHVARPRLRMSVDLVERHDGTGWHLGLVEQGKPFLRWARLEGCGERLNKRGQVGHALGVAGKTGVVQQVGAVDGAGEPLPVALVGRADGDPAVGGGEDLVGRGEPVRRSQSLRWLP